MQESQLVANPFALMLNPEAVIQAVERSQKLSRLQSRICRPLDNPLNRKAEEWDGADSQMGSLSGAEGL